MFAGLLHEFVSYLPSSRGWLMNSKKTVAHDDVNQWYGNKNLINWTTILKFAEKFDHPFSDLFIFINIFFNWPSLLDSHRKTIDFLQYFTCRPHKSNVIMRHKFLRVQLTSTFFSLCILGGGPLLQRLHHAVGITCKEESTTVCNDLTWLLLLHRGRE